MPKLPFVLPLAALLFAFAVPSSRAESLSCSSVNGVTLCSKSGSTSCQSMNGKTTCCETVGNQTECHDAPAVNPTRRTPPRDLAPPDDDDDGDAPAPLLLLPGRNLDISASVLSLLLLGSGIHPATPTVIPAFAGPTPSQLREITLASRIRRNQELLLLAGKLPLRRCGARCGALNSFDRWHHP